MAKPRINVVVTEDQHQLLMELGELQGRSASSFLREMLELTAPMLKATLTALKTAAAVAEKQPEEARKILDQAFALPEENDDQPTLLQFLGHLTGHRRSDASGPEPQRSEDRAARSDRDQL
jgi:uncharacterized protein (DUF1778 family)